MNRICVLLAEGFEEIEGLTVVDIIRRTGMEAVTASIHDSLQVTGSHNITVTADCFIKDVEFNTIDMLVLPGGMPGMLNLGKSEIVKYTIMQFYDKHKWLAAICSAPSIFGDLGILKGEQAVCYPGFEKHLSDAEVLTQNTVVSNKIITSRGMGTAIDFSLTIVEQFLGREHADKLSKALIYRS